MLFMVLEKFSPGNAEEIYRRVRENGRTLPEGLTYVDSWVHADMRGSFQLMECDDAVLLQEWIVGWGNLIDFIIVPVASSRTTAEMMARLAAPPA